MRAMRFHVGGTLLVVHPRRPLPAAFTLIDDAEAGIVSFAGIREGLELSSALAADRAVFPRAEAAWAPRP
jgi:hypothetical protein